jgi:hypothetical protein
MYVPVPFPPETPLWLSREFRAISEDQLRSKPYLMMDELHAEPDKPRLGMLVFADGTDWNPGGTGAGVYVYTGAAWSKL